jgi:glyoxylase-like metal-dependent hydrolase (beta-lactamase superfamily II)
MPDHQFGRVRFIRGENGGKYPFNHSLYLQGDKTRVILDPACSLQKLTRLRDEGVDEVWLSHWHEDHIHYLNLFEPCPVRISRRDFPPLTDINIFLDWYGLLSQEQRAYWTRVMKENFDYKPRQDAGFIEDDAVIDLGGLTVKVIATPGHTPGHLSFFIPEEELLFLGDYDLTSFGPWYGDVASSIEETIASIHKLKALPARRWVVAHNAGLYEQNPGPLWEAYERTIDEREQKLLTFLDRPKTLEEICSGWIVYGKPREPKEFFEFNEKVMIGKHLEYLLRRHEIILDGNTYEKVIHNK